MTITERVAYVHGLFDGLEIDVTKKEGKVLKGILDVLEDMALTITDLEEENDALQEVLDAMIEDIYDEDDSYDEEDVDGEELGYDPDMELFEVVCPSCGEEIFVDEATLSEGNISCPACGEELEFDMSSLDSEVVLDVPGDDFPDIPLDEEVPEDDIPEADDDYLEDD